VIPKAAVEAAWGDEGANPKRAISRGEIWAILEAAEPYMLAEAAACAHYFTLRPGWWRHRKSWMRWVCHCGCTTRTYDAVDRMGMRPIHPHMSVAVPGYNAREATK